MQGDLIKKHIKIHDVVEAGFLVGAIMNEGWKCTGKETENLSKKEEKHADNMKNIGALQFVQ
jgi:hypothetical protein